MGDLFVIYFEGADIGGAVGPVPSLARCIRPVVKSQINDTTGCRPERFPPPGALSDILSVYRGERRHGRGRRKDRDASARKRGDRNVVQTEPQAVRARRCGDGPR